MPSDLFRGPDNDKTHKDSPITFNKFFPFYCMYSYCIIICYGYGLSGEF
jgi:hypothetical protein